MSQYLSQIPALAESTEILISAMCNSPHANEGKIQEITDQSHLALAKMADYAKYLDERNEQLQE